MDLLEPAGFEEPGDDPGPEGIPQTDLRERKGRYHGEEKPVVDGSEDVSIAMHNLSPVVLFLGVQSAEAVRTGHPVRAYANEYG